MTIAISELRPAGSDLFMDSESYLNDFTESDAKSVYGGYGGGSHFSYGGDSAWAVIELARDANHALIAVKGFDVLNNIIHHVSGVVSNPGFYPVPVMPSTAE